MGLFLFILESIGTAELILIGIVALIFLGPRKLPSIAKTIGKTMADLRNTTNEFKSTWEREVNFEEEAKALRIDNLDDSTPTITPPTDVHTEGISAPEIKAIDASAFAPGTPVEAGANGASEDKTKAQEPESDEAALSEKKNWL